MYASGDRVLRLHAYFVFAVCFLSGVALGVALYASVTP